MRTAVFILGGLGLLYLQAVAGAAPAVPQASGPAIDAAAQAQKHKYGVPHPTKPIHNRKTDSDHKGYGNRDGYQREPKSDYGHYDRPSPDYRTSEDYSHQGYGDYPSGPGRDRDYYDRPTPDYRTSEDYSDRHDYNHHHHDKHHYPKPSTKGCKGALPPACQTSLPQTDYSLDPPACASTGATYAWAASCASTTSVGGTCSGVALCPTTGAAATATATCTATGWNVTNNCQPAKCAIAPGAPPSGTITSCNVPAFLNQVCGATCSGGLTPAIAAVCTANGWDVSGCCVPADFDLYSLGTINEQPANLPTGKGWTTENRNGQQGTQWDEAVVDVAGERVWRISNAITSGSFSDQPMSYTSCEVAGETGSALYNLDDINASPPGAFATSNQFYWRVSFKSATGAAQLGLNIELASQAKYSTWRMSRLTISDVGNGFNLTAVEQGGNSTSGITPPNQATSAFATFPVIASGLSYADWHTIETRIHFVDGIKVLGNNIVAGNDVLQVYLNGTLIHTGSTQEALYYVRTDFGIPPPRRQATDSLMFRVANPAAPATSGNGFYFKDVVVSNAFPVA